MVGKNLMKSAALFGTVAVLVACVAKAPAPAVEIFFEKGDATLSSDAQAIVKATAQEVADRNRSPVLVHADHQPPA